MTKGRPDGAAHDRAGRVRRLVVPIVFAGSAAVALAAAPPSHVEPTHRAAYAARLPDGSGMRIAERACLVCHSAMLIAQQRKDSTGWEKTVRQMEAWGAPVPAADHQGLIRYLNARLGVTAKK